MPISSFFISSSIFEGEWFVTKSLFLRVAFIIYSLPSLGTNILYDLSKNLSPEFCGKTTVVILLNWWQTKLCDSYGKANCFGQRVFQSGGTVYSPTSSVWSSSAFHPCRILSSVFNAGISVGVIVYCGFNFYFPDNADIEHWWRCSGEMSIQSFCSLWGKGCCFLFIIDLLKSCIF